MNFTQVSLLLLLGIYHENKQKPKKGYTSMFPVKKILIPLFCNTLYH